jgi:hypothetical protein
MVLTFPAILKLVWEMKILPKLGMRPVEQKSKPAADYPAKSDGRLPGTVPARE